MNTLAELIKKSHLFKNLTESQISKVAEKSTLKHLNPGQCFYREGDTPSGVFMLVEGKMGFTLTNDDGNELLLSYCTDQLWYGYPEVMASQVAIANAKVFEKARICVIPSKVFVQLTQEYPPLAQALIKRLSLNHLLLTQVVSKTSLNGLDYKVAKQLAMMCLYSGYDSDHGERCTLRTTQEEIANHVAASRQSINKIFKKWEADGKIALRFGEVEILNMSWLLQQV